VADHLVGEDGGFAGTALLLTSGRVVVKMCIAYE
jgi:hypothetical protein